MGLAQVMKLRWKSGLKSPESWSNVTEVGTEVLLGSNLGDMVTFWLILTKVLDPSHIDFHLRLVTSVDVDVDRG